MQNRILREDTLVPTCSSCQPNILASTLLLTHLNHSSTAAKFPIRPIGQKAAWQIQQLC